MGDGVDPGVVAVAADQHDRPHAGHLVELAPRSAGASQDAERWPQPTIGTSGPSASRWRPGQRLLDRAGAVQVEPRRGERPLAEVHVLVPEPRHQPAAVRA